MPLIIAGVIAAAGSIAGAAMSSSAASSAASTQANAADYSAQLQAELGQEGVNLQTEQYNNSLTNAWPFLESGYGAEANLDYLLGINPQGNYPTAPSFLSAPGIPGVAAGTPTTPAISSGSTVPLSTLVNAGTSDNPVGARGGQVQPTTPITVNPGGGRGTTTTTPGMAPLSSLVNPALGGFGSLLSPYPGGQFTAPTLAQAEQQPGYQFQLQQGLSALQNSAAARGGLLTGSTLTDINNYAQGAAQTDYSNVYNQMLNTYQTNYNTWSQQQANLFNRLSALAGGGQTTASQLNSQGLQTGNSIGSLLTGTGNYLSNDLQNAAAARASGYVGSSNAWNSGIGGATSALSELAFLNNFNGSSGGGPYGTGVLNPVPTADPSGYIPAVG